MMVEECRLKILSRHVTTKPLRRFLKKTLLEISGRTDRSAGSFCTARKWRHRR